MDRILSPRLAAVAAEIPPCRTVADIGTDHAFLPIFLVQNGRCERVYASDIRQGPLLRAKTYLNRYLGAGQTQVIPVLGDGLENIPERCDVVVIAGMGGDTVVGILQKADPTPDQRFVLQVMTSAEDVRRYLNGNGWETEDETVVEDGKYLYTVMRVRPGTGREYAEEDAYFSPPLRKKRDKLTLRYLNRQIDRLQTVIRGKQQAQEPRSTENEQRICMNFRRIRDEYFGG